MVIVSIFYDYSLWVVIWCLCFNKKSLEIISGWGFWGCGVFLVFLVGRSCWFVLVDAKVNSILLVLRECSHTLRVA